MTSLHGSSYDEPWRGLPLELRTLIYHHLLCPPGGIKMVPFVRGDTLGPETDRDPGKLYVEEQRFSYKDSGAYNLDRDHPTGRVDASVDENGFSDYDRGLVRDPPEKLAPKREQNLGLGILFTNKQTHDEAMRCVCSQNTWHFDARCDRILYFLQWLDPSYVALIRNVRFTSEAVVRHKGNDRHQDLTAFLSDQMRLRTVTLDMPEDYHPRSYLYNRGEPRYIQDVYQNLTRAVFDAKIRTLSIHYDHANSDPLRKPLTRLEPVRAVYRLYEKEYRDMFYDMMFVEFYEYTKEYERPPEEPFPFPNIRPAAYDEMVEDHRRLYPVRISMRDPEGPDEIGPVVSFHVDIGAAKAEYARVKALIATGANLDIEMRQARELRVNPHEWPDLRFRMKLARDALEGFEDREAWTGGNDLLKPVRPLMKRTRSSYLGMT